jgi:hypothetical protein
LDRFDNIRVFAKVVESSNFAGAAAQKGFRSIVPDLPFLSVLVCILAKGSDDCEITRIPRPSARTAFTERLRHYRFLWGASAARQRRKQLRRRLPVQERRLAST